MAQETALNNGSKDNRRSTMELMTSFDFSVPIEINVIFDDSDDELKLKEESIDITDDMPNEYGGVSDYAPLYNDSPNCEERNETELPNNGNLAKANEAKEIKNCFKKSHLKRKHVDADSSSKRATAKNKPSKHDNSDTTYNCNAQCNTNNCNNNIAPETNPQENISAMCNKKPETNNNTVDQTANVYIVDLLKSVAEFLIKILECHDYVMKMKINSSVQQKEEEKYWRSFIRLKYNYFTLAYCTVTTIILPQIENQDFVAKFFDDTILLSAENNKIAKTDLCNVFSELIDWCKRKKDWLDSIKNPKDLFCSSPLLIQQLSAPVRPPNVLSTVTEQIVVNQILNGGKETNIAALNSNYKTMISSEPFNGTNIMNNPKPGSNVAVFPFHEALIHHRHNDLPTNQQGDAHINSSYHNICAVNISDQTEVPSRLSSYPIVNNVNHQNQPRPPYSAISNSCSLQSQPLPQRIPTYNSPIVQPARRPVVPEMSSQATANEQQNFEVVRSISTDSGYLSPPPQYPTNTEPVVQQHISQTPVVEHVTSLHPNAILIPESSCYVCGSRTRKMCLGCYKRYYCSTSCQYRDWKNHVVMCKGRTIR